jgi:hypothetical protein
MDRNALPIASALGEVAFKAALRAIAMLLITLSAVAVLAGAAFVTSAIEASQAELSAGEEIAEPAIEDILLMPAEEPSTRM